MLRKCPERLLTPSSGEMPPALQPVKCVLQLCICKHGTTETYLALRHIQKVVFCNTHCLCSMSLVLCCSCTHTPLSPAGRRGSEVL